MTRPRVPRQKPLLSTALARPVEPPNLLDPPWHGSFPKSGDLNEDRNILSSIILIALLMGAPQMVPRILGNPHMNICSNSQGQRKLAETGTSREP